jgi:DNA repair exonuclease SbcCD ATPase subunit
MIEFQQVKFQNFLSFGNTPTIFKFNTHQRTVIIGKNGEGKSTIIDVLIYALFGKPFRKIKKAKLINNINDGELLVELDFKIKYTQYKIIRGIKPNVFDIYIDGVLVPQDSKIKDYQKYLEKDILNLNYTTFTQIVILGSSSYVPFMRMYTNTKREIIEDILNISVFSRMNELLKQDLKEAEQKLLLLEKDKELAKKQYSFLYEKYTTNSISKEKRLEEKNETINTLEQDIQELSLEIDQLKDQLYPDCDQTYIAQKTEKLNKLDNLLSFINKNIKSCKKKILFYQKNDICPECDQKIDHFHKEKKLLDLQTKSKEYNEAVLNTTPKISASSEFIQEMNKKINSNKEKQKIIDKKKIKYNQIQSQIEYLKSDIEEINNTEYEFVSLEELETLKEEVKTTDAKVVELKKKMNIMRKGLDILKDNGAKTAIIKFYLPFINQIINEFLEKFNFNIKFLFDENFDEHIRGRGYKDFSYGNFSEGQKLRIDLALMFTWREVAKKKNSASTNLLFFDEILDSAMDSEGVSNFIDILDTPNESINTFIISHRPDVNENNFDSIIEANIENQFSKYKQKEL